MQYSYRRFKRRTMRMCTRLFRYYSYCRIQTICRAIKHNNMQSSSSRQRKRNYPTQIYRHFRRRTMGIHSYSTTFKHCTNLPSFVRLQIGARVMYLKNNMQELFPSSPTTKVSTNSYGEYHLNIQCFSFGFGPLNTFHLSLIHSSGSGFSFRLLRLPLHQKVRGCRK